MDFLIKAYSWIFPKFGATHCTPYLPIPLSMHMYSPGPWSDRHGRKLLILIPILGQVLTCTTFILNVVLFDLLPFEALYMEYINELRQRMFRFKLKFRNVNFMRIIRDRVMPYATTYREICLYRFFSGSGFRIQNYWKNSRFAPNKSFLKNFFKLRLWIHKGSIYPQFPIKIPTLIPN